LRFYFAMLKSNVYRAALTLLSDLMTTQNFEPLLSQAEAGQLLQLHEKTVARMAKQGQLPAIRVGRYWRFRASSLNQ
jgi:excisionase family DNA binding protein